MSILFFLGIGLLAFQVFKQTTMQKSMVLSKLLKYFLITVGIHKRKHVLCFYYEIQLLLLLYFIQILFFLLDEYDVEIMTDSEFLQNCVHLWMYGKWKWNGWKNNKGRTLANKIMLMKLDKLIGRMRSVTVV